MFFRNAQFDLRNTIEVNTLLTANNPLFHCSEPIVAKKSYMKLSQIIIKVIIIITGMKHILLQQKFFD